MFAPTADRAVLAMSNSPPQVERMEPRRLLSAFVAHVDFQTPNAAAPAPYVADSGAMFADRGNGFSYGWNGPRPAQVIERHVRKGGSADPRYDAFAVMNSSGRGSRWQIAVPNGVYDVSATVGDPNARSGRYRILVDGIQLLNGKATPSKRWVSGSKELTVSNGVLTLTVPRGASGKIDFIDIQQVVQVESPPPLPPPPLPPPPPPPPPPPTPFHLSWQQMANSPVGRLEASAVTVAGKLYVFGGYGVDNPNWLATKETDVYDPTTNTWTRLADMPEGLTHIGAATDGRYIYAAGGYVSNYKTGWQTFATSDVWRYDTVTNQWTAFVPLPAARSAGALLIIGNELHYVDGNDINRVGTTEHWILNLDDANPQWVDSTPLPFSRNHIAAAVLDGKIYVIGGQAGNDDGAPSSDFLMWDPANPSSWTVLPSLPQPRSHAVAVAVDGKIVVADGVTSGLTPLSSVVAYDPTTNSWSTVSDPLPAPREDPTGDIVDGRLVVTTGYDQSLRTETWISQVLS